MVSTVPTQIEAEARRLLGQMSASVRGVGKRQAFAACETLLPRMLEMLSLLPHRPAHSLRPVIRRCLEELVYLDATASDDTNLQALQSEADLLVNVLEQVRRMAEERGLWTQPAPEPMCG